MARAVLAIARYTGKAMALARATVRAMARSKDRESYGLIYKYTVTRALAKTTVRAMVRSKDSAMA
jgi:hypothetical protein